QLALDFADTDIDGYAEQSGNGLAQRFADQGVESLILGAGVQVARAVSTDFGVLQPFGRLGWQREFDNDARELTSTFVGDANGTTLAYATQSPDRNFGDVTIGLTAVFGNGRSLFLAYRYLLGHEFLDDGQLQFGGRFEF
ncbi:MAG: autotransporter outer membrane beta-barrel domain-containing protein, partial [Pseudomonadota bacterium]